MRHEEHTSRKLGAALALLVALVLTAALVVLVQARALDEPGRLRRPSADAWNRHVQLR